MTTKNIIKFIYEAIENNKVTTSRYHDNDWAQVNKVVRVIDTAVSLIEDERNQKLQVVPVTVVNEGSVVDGNPRKIYKYIVINEDYQSIIRIDIICSFCGTVEDILSAYDITVLQTML